MKHRVQEVRCEWNETAAAWFVYVTRAEPGIPRKAQFEAESWEGVLEILSDLENRIKSADLEDRIESGNEGVKP
jgi:hypothetical protein